ncbi:hypothetical protein [Thalassobaculum sp.]|uniref:hypothetical protein n=1 Tax=Thalassobaculum sp. TaxID=2022740 RepID=UPI0032EEDF9A
MVDITERMTAMLSDLCKAARAGRRCPDAQVLRLMGHISATNTVLALAEAGKIKIEVYGHNWRVIEILEGPDAGSRTEESPLGGKPWLMIDDSGRHRMEAA